MNPMKYFELLERMDQMLRMENTGDAKEFSLRLGISRRQLYYYIDELKVLGLPIAYSRRSKTFYYEKQCMLKIDISVKELGFTDLYSQSGGNFFEKFYFVQSLCTIAI
jgi:predicted DNA-binding transcriptional regulator YafY